LQRRGAKAANSLVTPAFDDPLQVVEAVEVGFTIPRPDASDIT
jgi:hypothetical protein